MFRRLLSFAAGCSLLAVGCSSSSDSAPSGPGHTGDDRGVTGPPSVAGDVSIQLGDGTGALGFAPDETLVVPVKVTPPASYVVKFALAGDTRDAFLDKSEAVTDNDGSASVVLTAPSSPVEFGLRASTSGVTEELRASAKTDRTILHVIPVYAGTRSVSAWTATVSPGEACDPLDPVPPPDRGLLGEVETDEEDVPVPNVPLGSRLRVTVRAGHFAGGCTTVPALKVGERRTVSVTVTDTPLAMTNVRIPTVLGIDQDDNWAAGFSSLAALMASKAVRGSKSDATALLDEMVVATPFLWQDEFIYQRIRLGWDDRVAHVFDGGDTAFRDRLKAWILESLSSLATNAIAGTLTSPAADSGTASFTATQVAGAAPSDSGFPDKVALTWTSGAADQVLFGATATWQPSRLAATLAYAAAKKEFPKAADMPGALALALSCKQIGETLAGAPSDVVALNCDASCLASRCEDALDEMWERAQNASTAKAQLHIAATGSAMIDDSAHPVGFVGSWVGDVSLGAKAIRAGGAARGTSPNVEPR